MSERSTHGIVGVEHSLKTGETPCPAPSRRRATSSWTPRRTLAGEGLAAVSARSIAARAGVNQALVFYHFGTVSDLLEATVRRSVDLAVASYRDRFGDVTSVAKLLTLGRDLLRTEQSRGNVAQMAQVMAGARSDEALAGPGATPSMLWAGETEAVLARILPGSPLEGLIPPAGLPA